MPVGYVSSVLGLNKRWISQFPSGNKGKKLAGKKHALSNRDFCINWVTGSHYFLFYVNDRGWEVFDEYFLHDILLAQGQMHGCLKILETFVICMVPLALLIL